ncbi:apolipophorins [Ceratitis capitata]|uniref:Apolipophorins n=2 Tax=Ceratitis capitata TaxID=7213 RepID=W8BIF3_CERCA|nr:apolipophorins [Ceratitis capitata]
MNTINFGQFKAFLILFCISAISISVVTTANTCKRGCTQSDNGVLKFQPGNVYEYNFDSVITVDLDTGASKGTDDTSLRLTGTAKIYAEGNCGYTLQLSAVKVLAAKEAAEKKLVQSVQKPVHFTLTNDKVEPQFCADYNDYQYALNIKRAIISLLQSNSEDGIEVDIFGQCSTHTSVSNVGETHIVTKVRDLNQCRFRENTRSSLIHGVINQAAGVKSAHLFKASYTKESKIVNGIVENTHLIEDYSFGIAEKGINRIRGKVITNLKIRNPAGTPSAPPQTGTHGVSLIFQKPEVYITKNLAALKTALNQLVDLLNDYVKKDSATSFTDLIRLMRNADTDTLLELAIVPHENTILARKVYLDALFRTGTAESAKAIFKQLNKMDEKEKLIAIISLNLVQSVDKDTLIQASALLTPNASNQVYLSIGTLVAKYCQVNDCEQGDLDGISKKFIENLKHCKANTMKDEDRIVNILKGITNMKKFSKNSVNALVECSSVGRSNRIRVAALQAFTSANCDSVLIQKALTLLRDRNEDSELRIEAYLAAINCPNSNVAIEIAAIVNSEKVNQVGGFIASSLKAIRDSTDDYRTYQRYHLNNIRVTKQFPRDPRRYSCNNEISYKLDALGLSASSDYKVIYSQHGFLPRSTKLNISTEIFGTNFNVFEVNVRQENLENVLEYYIGPKGLLNKDFEEIIKIIEDGGVSGDNYRARRNIADETAKLSKKYKAYGTKNIQDVNLDLSLKFFGSEMLFLSLGDHIPNTLDEIIKSLSTAFDTVKKELLSYNKEFMFHDLFLDVNAIYPTGLGIPLEINTQGFTANKLDFGINLDVDGILEQNWLATKYQAKIVPSVDINLKFQLGFNAYVLAAGLQVESNFHSASGADVKLDFINEGNEFNLNIKLPRNKLDLINVEVIPGFYVTDPDKPFKVIVPKDNKKQNSDNYQMCFSQLDVVGLNLCIDVSGVSRGKELSSNAGYFISLVRPVSLNVYTEVERKYNLRGSYISQTNSGSQEWKLELNMPESKEHRSASVTFEVGSNPSTYGRLAFDTPLYHFAFESGFNNDNHELVLYAQHEDNEKVNRNRIGFIRNGNEYLPIIEVQDKSGTSNEFYGYRMDGKVILQNSGDNQAKYIFDSFKVANKGKDRVIVNGWTEVGSAWLNSELRVGILKDTYLVKSNFGVNNGIYDIGFFINDEQTPENIYGGSGHVQLAEQAFVVQLVGAAASWKLDLNNEVQYALSESSNSLESSSFKHESTLKNQKSVVGQFKLKLLTSGNNKIDLNTELVSGKRTAALAIKYNGNGHPFGDYNIEIHGKYNKHYADIIAKNNFNGNRFVIDNTLVTSWGTSFTIKGEIGQRFTAQDIYIDMHGTAQINNKNKQFQWIIKVIGTPDKTNSEVKITSDSADILKCTGDLQHPQDKISSGKIHVSAKNLAVLKADFKVAKNGKGDANVAVETLKTDQSQKIDINIKFQVQAPKYEVETAIVFSGDKKIYFKTDSHLEKMKFITKNVAEISNKKLTIDANFAVKGDFSTNGELQGNFIFTSPTGHIVDGNIKRKITTNTKTGNVQGDLDVQISKARNGQKQTLAYTAKADKLNLKTKELSEKVQLIYTDINDKKLELYANVKHLPKDKSKTVEIKAGVRGDYLNIPVDVNFVVDEYDSNHAVFRVDIKCAGAFIFNVNGRYNLGGNDIPAVFEVQLNSQLPKNNIKSIQLNSNGKFLNPKTNNGTYIIELHVDKQTGDSQYLRLNTLWKGSQQQGAYTFDVDTTEMNGPLKLEGTYQNEQPGDTKDGSAVDKQHYSFNFNYDNKFVKSTANLSYVGIGKATAHYTLNANFESVKYIDFDISMQKLDVDTYEINLHAKGDEIAYMSNMKIYHSQYRKGLDMHISTPEGSPIVIVGVFEISGEQKSKISVNIQNVIDLDFTCNWESSYNAIDDFSIKADWNSVRLNLPNYLVDIRSQGKSITFNFKNSKHEIMSGSATYSLKKEKSKSILEGHGQVKYYGKPQKISFRLIHQIYDIATHKETGFSYSLDGNYGPKKGVSTFKITTGGFDVKFSICEEKKQCTNVQVQSLVTPNSKELDSSQNSLLIVIDLRELGYPYELEFQSKTVQQGIKLHYSIESQFVSNNNLKYKLSANIQPMNLVIQIKLPNRELLFEGMQQLPENGRLFGRYENILAFYFDKTNKPNDVTRISAVADVTGNELPNINVNSEIKFENAAIRPLSISGKFDANREKNIVNCEVIFDIFRLPEQKIIGTLRTQNSGQGNGFNITTFESLQSSGLGFNYEFSGHTALNIDLQILSAGTILRSGATDLKVSANIYATKDHTDLSVYILNEPIVQVAADFNRQKFSVNFNSKVKLFSQAAVELKTELQPTQSKLVLKRKGLLDLNADVKLGKEIELNIKGVEEQLFKGRVALDAANFLQATYSTNSDAIKAFLNVVESEIKKDSNATVETIKRKFRYMRETIDRQAKFFEASTPDLAKLKSNYEENVNDIVRALENDPILKQISENYQIIYTKLVQVSGDISKIVAEYYGSLNKSIAEFYKKLETSLRENVLPAWEDLLVTASKMLGDLRVQIVNVVTELIQQIWESLKQYGPALENYTKTIKELSRPLNEAVQELVKATTETIENLIEEFREYITKLPTIDELQNQFNEKLEKLQLLENTLNFINNLFDQLHILPLTPESLEFIEKLREYSEAKITNKHIHDEQLLKELTKLLVRALRSIWSNLDISSSLAPTDIAKNMLSAILDLTSESLDLLGKMPMVLSFRFSVLNFILNENLEYIFSIRNWIFLQDFNLHGHIVDGHNIFTFDGQHYSFPSSCKYILAQDTVDNNFTVVAQVNNGKLKTIILTDRENKFVEISDSGTLKINGKEAEYPQHLNGIHSWRLYYTVWLQSEYGVEIMCTQDLKICNVKVNGFYTGKIRGLLGNGNAEPYDDFIQIDGTITPDYVTFGNGYGIGKCAPVAARPVELVSHSDICSDLFGLQSPLMPGYILENPSPYRSRCDAVVHDAAEKEKEAAACLIAAAYGSALKMKGIPITLPSRCLKCAGPNGQRELGQEFTVKIPNNKADIVFVVDMDVSHALLSNLIAPAILEMRDSLKIRGFTDVQIGAIAYNNSQLYPALLTSNGGKINYQDNLAYVKLNGSKNICVHCISQELPDTKVVEIFKVIEIILRNIVPQSDEKAFKLALDYPFRAGAAKSIVGVRSNNLEFDNLFKLVRAHLTDVETKFNGAQLHLIGPVKELSAEGIPKEKLIGFNSRLIATLDGKDIKKRQKLQFENDISIDFVLKNGGWVFATNNFDQMKPNEQKKNVNQIVNTLADTLFRTEIVSECECEVVHGLHAQHRCTIKSSNFLINKKVKTK